MQWEEYQESEFAGKNEGTVLAGSEKGRHFLLLLEGHKKILDIGCNDGGFTSFLASKGFNVVGFDLPRVVMKAKRLFPKIHFVGGSAEKKLPFKEDSFDAILASEVLEHVRNDFFFIGELHRILDKNGVLVLSTPNRNYLIHKWLRLFGYKWDEGINLHVRAYSVSELSELLSGFSSVKVTGIPFSFIDPDSSVGWIERILPSSLRHTLVATAKK